MNDNYRPGGFSMMPPAVKNLLIINVIFFLATMLLRDKGVDLYSLLGLSWVESANFRPWQFITYMFMHADFGHLFFNMFALWMFGYLIENFWGTKRFLIFYFVTGVGAALLQFSINWFEFHQLHETLSLYSMNPNVSDFAVVLKDNFSHMYREDVVNGFISEWTSNAGNPAYVNESLSIFQELLTAKMSIPMVGASGAVFGILLAFGMMFPNQRIYLYFLFPIKAKYFVILYGAAEFFFGVSGYQSGIAHFAHLGGMLFGLLLILYWRNKYKFRR
ncbi:hypothetical protein SDC9_58328 [bioreactor metagenome]|uniref:Peptidase S54 rhomboid domain-containing protein n=1 Tax=bioreactor metagenome TaxID=1076179 RepID=A0A644X7S3_9ZZZZ